MLFYRHTRFAFIITLLTPLWLWSYGEQVLLLTEDKCVASEVTAYEQYARSVAISADVAVVGNSLDDVPDIDAGSAYVYRYVNNSWAEEAKLTAVDGARSDEFGSAVSVSGNVILVSASKDSDNGADSGSAYIFRYSSGGWNEEAKVIALDGESDDGFGESVSISGNTAIIGAYGNDDVGSNSGSAYVFRYDDGDWTEEAKLTASDAGNADWFSRGAVAVSGDVALVGAYGNDDAGTNSGAAYVFRFNGSIWVEEAKLTAPDADRSDQFGYRVALLGTTAVVAANTEDGLTYQGGAVYIFKYNGSAWLFDEKLLASDGESLDEFGSSLSLSGDTLIVGSNNSENGYNAGAVYIFKDNGTTWIEETKLLATDGESRDHFGFSSGISGEHIIVGAYQDDDNGAYSGSVYFSKRSDTEIYIDESRQPNDKLATIAFIDAEGHTITSVNKITDADRKFDIIQDSGNYYLVVSSGASFDLNVSSQHGVTIEVTDSSGETHSQTFIVSIRRTDFVVAYDDTYDVDEDSVLTIAHLEGVLSNDSYNGDTGLSSTIVIQPNYGTLNLNSDGAFDYTPAPDFNGVDQFTYRAENLASLADDAIVNINVNPVNDFPTEILMDDYIEMKLVAPDAMDDDYLGFRVAASNDIALLGAQYDIANGLTSGSAYLYRYELNSWFLEAKLVPSSAANGLGFGYDVSVSGEVAAITSQGNLVRRSGHVYIFRYNGSDWIEEIVIRPTDVEDSDRFGCSVSTDSNVIVVGSFLDDDVAGSAGAAYIFRHNGSTWIQDIKLTPSDGIAGGRFGTSVAIEGDVAVVGASLDSDGGSAYVYRYNGSIWVEEQKLSATDGGGSFGGSVSIYGNAIIVGARSNSAAYVFKYNGSVWTEEQKLTPADSGIMDWFGSDVSIGDDVALVGKVYDDELADNAGAAYVFRYDGIAWTEVQKLTAFDGAYTDLYGESVALSGNKAIIGSYQADHVGHSIDSGAAYAYDISQGDMIKEDMASGELAITFSTLDIDSSTFTYELISDSSGFFEISGDQLRVADGNDVDYEEKTSHLIVIEANDGQGGTVQQSFTLYLSDVVGDEHANQLGYVTWRDRYFDSNEVGSGMNDDYDHDSVTNLIEYALGRSPRIAASEGLPTAVINSSNLDFTFNRDVAGLVYRIQSSTDLDIWTDQALNPGIVGNHVTVPVEMPADGNLFMRLKIELE